MLFSGLYSIAICRICEKWLELSADARPCRRRRPRTRSCSLVSGFMKLSGRIIHQTCIFICNSNYAIEQFFFTKLADMLTLDLYYHVMVKAVLRIVTVLQFIQNRKILFSEIFTTVWRLRRKWMLSSIAFEVASDPFSEKISILPLNIWEKLMDRYFKVYVWFSVGFQNG